jgi:hypothetical protein
VSEKSVFAVLTSEHQVKVVGMPSQSCIYKYSISEGTVAKASVCSVNCKFTSPQNSGSKSTNFFFISLPLSSLDLFDVLLDERQLSSLQLAQSDHQDLPQFESTDLVPQRERVNVRKPYDCLQIFVM